jgi:hypothetical protein
MTGKVPDLEMSWISDRTVQTNSPPRQKADQSRIKQRTSGRRVGRQV